MRTFRASFKARLENAVDTLLQHATSSSIFWQSPVSGVWSTAADWSGGVAPTSSSDVTIAVAGTYTVTIAAPAAADSLTLDNASARIVDSASLSIATTLYVQAGTFTLAAGASISGGAISIAGAGKFVLSSGATLSGVTYDGVLSLKNDNQTLTIAGGPAARSRSTPKISPIVAAVASPAACLC